MKRGRKPAVRPQRQAVDLSADRPDISKTINALVAAVQKVHGTNAIGRLDQTAYEGVVGTYPTGLASLDEAIGIGGFPLAKLVQISGPESVGKSTLCKWLIHQAQVHGITPWFIDGEMSRDTPERYAALGISSESVAWSDAIYLEDAFSYAATGIITLRKLNKPAIVFIDSIASFMVRSADAERDFDEHSRRAPKATFLAQNIPKLIETIRGTQIGLVFVNQLRQKQKAGPYEDPYYEPGGMALRHFCHVILRLNRVGQIKDGEAIVGIKSRVRVQKSKLAPPSKQAGLALYFDGRVESLDLKDLKW